jgi:hypothetical protein
MISPFRHPNWIVGRSDWVGASQQDGSVSICQFHEVLYEHCAPTRFVSHPLLIYQTRCLVPCHSQYTFCCTLACPYDFKLVDTREAKHLSLPVTHLSPHVSIDGSFVQDSTAVPSSSTPGLFSYGFHSCDTAFLRPRIELFS